MLSAKFMYRRVPDIKVLVRREVHKSYYDLLGLTPKASQADIKQAYYKMSMVYHPDKGASNPDKFREISTAYEVLGNNKLRKMYDKGLLPTTGKFAQDQKSEPQKVNKNPESRTTGRAEQKYDDKMKSQTFYGSTKKEKKFTGKTEQYDFDAWTQAHYSEMFEDRVKNRIIRKRKKLTAEEEATKKADIIATSIFILFIAVAYVYTRNALNHDYIKPNKPTDD